VNAPKAQRLLAKLVDPALAAMLLALVAASWLALFFFVPLEFIPPRVR
jgi:hypothetical protein